MFKKVGKFLGLGKDGAENGGILNLISEKTGKISFRRVAATFILVNMVPSLDWASLTWPQVALMGTCVVFSIFDKHAEAILAKISSK